MGRAKPKGVSSNPAQANEFFVAVSNVRMKTNERCNYRYINYQVGRFSHNTCDMAGLLIVIVFGKPKEIAMS